MAFTTSSPPFFCSAVAWETCWVMSFIFSTAWMIWRLPSACSLVAMPTWEAILFMFSTARRTWRPPAACSLVE